MTFTNHFLVLPEHTNDMAPLIFGGAFMSQLDLCAAMLTKNLLREPGTPADNAVTYKADFTFHAPSYQGDVIRMHAENKKKFE